MKIAYLHIGPTEHGIGRYGRLLAKEAYQNSELEVVEAFVELKRDRRKSRELLIKAAQKLSEADVVHIQFSKYGSRLWNSGWLKWYYLRIFFKHCLSPVVITLHDVYYSPYRFTRLIEILKRKLLRNISRLTSEEAYQEGLSKTVKSSSDADVYMSNTSQYETLAKNPRFIRPLKKGIFVTKEIFGPEAFILTEIASSASKLIVCTEEEANRIKQRVDPSKVKIIPHFVEHRSISISSDEARKELDLQGVKVITLLGFIYPSKGHQILVEAMPKLPENVIVVFAGGPSSNAYEGFVQDLRSLAEQEGVGDRLRITGYLPEETMEMYLSATDLAVCPFSRVSASGSLSTWISVACPILASKSPQIEEYNKIESGAINTFSPYKPEVLAQAIGDLMNEFQNCKNLAIKRLRAKLLMPKIFDQHKTIYRSVSK